MEGSDSNLSERQIFRLQGKLKEMTIPFLHRLADEYEVEIPFEARDMYTIINAFIDELSLEAKKKILGEYGDAGRPSTYIFISEEKNPSIQTVFQKAKALSTLELDSQFWELHPYYDEVEVDYTTRTLRIRFHYLKGSILTIDENGREKEHRLHHSGVVVYRPESKILEVRVKDRSMARKMAVTIPTILGLESFISLNLMDKTLNRAFVDWISSLNSATIQLPISEVSGSLIITARKGMDLRTAKRYNEELKYGRLRGGHVTIERNKDHKTNFRIHFRDCHIWFTLFTNEDDIGYVIDAIEKIAEGFQFAKPDRMLTRYFEKEN